MFQTAMCPSSVELLYQCETWFMSLCVDVENGNKHTREIVCQFGYLQGRFAILC
jgi:hypothetical protein